jgi:hypothetical protein
MATHMRLFRILLIVPIALIGLSFLVSLLTLPGTGTFHADSYYLPLREFVAEPQRKEMESKVIEIYNSQQRTRTIMLLARDGVCLVCLVAARLLAVRSCYSLTSSEVSSER